MTLGFLADDDSHFSRHAFSPHRRTQAGRSRRLAPGIFHAAAISGGGFSAIDYHYDTLRTRGMNTQYIIESFGHYLRHSNIFAPQARRQLEATMMP